MVWFCLVDNFSFLMDAHFINHSLYLKITIIHLVITISYKGIMN